MVDPAAGLKIRAEILHKQIAAGDARARPRLRQLLELKTASDEALARAAATLPRKHCLTIVARETGFSTWEHALRVLHGDASELDLGTFLHAATSGTLNAWFTRHDEARAHLDERRVHGHDAFLLGYKRHFFVVDRAYIEALGLDADDPDWEAIDFDWVRPRDASARSRLVLRRLAAMRGRP